MPQQSRGIVDKWATDEPPSIDIAEVYELCNKLSNSLIEYETNPQSNVCVVSRLLQEIAKPIYRLDGQLNPERLHAQNAHRDRAIMALRLKTQEDKLGVIRTTVDELAKRLEINELLHSDWDSVRNRLRSKWELEELPTFDRVYIERLQSACKQEDVHGHQSTNSPRDEWMHGLKADGLTLGLIRAALAKEHPEWDQIETEQGVGRAIDRHCERNDRVKLRRKQ